MTLEFAAWANPFAEMKIWRREGARWERESKAIFDILRELPNRHANEDLGLYTVLWDVGVCVCVCIYTHTSLYCKVEVGTRDSYLEDALHVNSIYEIIKGRAIKWAETACSKALRQKGVRHSTFRELGNGSCDWSREPEGGFRIRLQGSMERFQVFILRDLKVIKMF